MSKGLLGTSALVAAVLVSSVTWADRPIDVEAAARAYRIRVYATFRQNRTEYDQRIERGREVLSAWRRAKATEAEEQAVLVWFLKANEASVFGAEQPLPQLAELPTLNQRSDEAQRTRVADNSNRRQTDGTRRAKSSAAKVPTKAPAKTVSSMMKFSQMLGDRVSQALGGNGNPPAPSAPETGPETADTAPLVSDSEALLAQQPNSNVAEAPAGELDETTQQLNESIAGHNAVVSGIRDQLLSEWDFDPESAAELIAKLEATTINEVALGQQIGAVDPSYHSQLSPLESVNSLLGEVDERLQALQAGWSDFESMGFDEAAAQRLFERVEQMRAQLDF